MLFIMKLSRRPNKVQGSVGKKGALYLRLDVGFAGVLWELNILP